MDLLFGCGKRRYFSMARVWQKTSRVGIRGFSAGRDVGLALVHVLKEIKSRLVSWLTFWVGEVAAGHCGGVNDVLWQSML